MTLFRHFVEILVCVGVAATTAIAGATGSDSGELYFGLTFGIFGLLGGAILGSTLAETLGRLLRRPALGRTPFTGFSPRTVPGILCVLVGAVGLAFFFVRLPLVPLRDAPFVLQAASGVTLGSILARALAGFIDWLVDPPSYTAPDPVPEAQAEPTDAPLSKWARPPRILLSLAGAGAFATAAFQDVVDGIPASQLPPFIEGTAIRPSEDLLVSVSTWMVLAAVATVFTCLERRGNLTVTVAFLAAFMVGMLFVSIFNSGLLLLGGVLVCFWVVTTPDDVHSAISSRNPIRDRVLSAARPACIGAGILLTYSSFEGFDRLGSALWWASAAVALNVAAALFRSQPPPSRERRRTLIVTSLLGLGIGLGIHLTGPHTFERSLVVLEDARAAFQVDTP